MLPTDNTERKALPVYTFLTKYFPLAFLEVVRVAVAGDKQHGNTGPEIQWAREKSTDQLNTALRHLMDYGMGRRHDTDGRAHLAKAICRLSAQLQLDEEASRKPFWKNLYAKTDEFRVCNECNHIVPDHYPSCSRAQGPSVADSANSRVWVTRTMYDETGVPWGTASVLKPRPPRICNDCGADLDAQAHAASCLRFNQDAR